MAFYEDRVEHFGGALVLFKRNLSVVRVYGTNGGLN